MCTSNTLQHKIRKHTDNGDLIINFRAVTIRGEYPDAKYHHKLEAAKLLSRYDSYCDTPRHSNEHRKNTPSPSMGEGRDGGDESPLSPQHTCHSCESRNPEGLGDGRPHFWGLIPTPEELAATPSRHSRAGRHPEGQGGDAENPPLPQGEGWGEGENILHNEPVVRESEALGHRTENSELKTDNSTVTHLDILNYDIAHLIRRETADGHTIVQFLSHVMTGPDKPFTPKKLRIRHTDRMAAAREVIRRGFGHFGRKRKLVHDYDDEADAYDTLHTDLAKRMREYTEHGTDAVRFLLDVMEDADPDDPYTWHHRVSAAQELIRRGWDTNYDAITPELLQAYWQNQDSTRLSTGQKKHLAALRESREKVPFVLSPALSLSKGLSKDESTREPKNTATTSARHSHEDRNPEGSGLGMENSNLFVLSVSKDESAREPKNPTAIPTRHSRECRNPEGPGTGTGTENSNPFVLSVSKDESAREPKNTEATPTRRSCVGRNPASQSTGTENSNPFVLSPVLSLSKGLPPTRSEEGSSSKPEPTTKPPLPQGEGWGEGESLVQSHSPNQSEIPNRHSLKACPQTRSGSGTPAPQNEQEKSSPSMSVLPDPDLDCYYEPLNPEEQAIFDHELRLESGDLPDSVLPEPRPEHVEGPVEGPIDPSPAAWREYELALTQIAEAAAREGIPLLPNPLAGTLHRPAIRSP